MNITQFFYIAPILLLLAGCGPRIWANYELNANFDRDNTQCHAYASGNAPMPQQKPLDTVQNFSGMGMVNGQSYMYSGTIYPDPYKNMQTSFNNLAASSDA